MNNYKRIGIVGGISPQSSAMFYKKIIEKHHQKYKDQYYPEIVLFSVNFDRLKDLQKEDNQEEYINELVKAIECLEKAGADFAVIASNTPHRVFYEIEKKVSIKLLSIVEAVASYTKIKGFEKVLLLGTIYTMKENYYKLGFNAQNIKTIVPSEIDQEVINDIIFNELTLGKISKESKINMLEIIQKHVVDAVVLGCTELPLIVQEEDLSIPIINTTDIFANATLEFALL